MKFQSIPAVHPHWSCDLLLQVDGDNVAHTQAWSWGKFNITEELLIVYWNDYPADRFIKIGNTYIHESFGRNLVPGFKNLNNISFGNKNVQITHINVKIPNTENSVSLRTGSSDGDVFLQIFVNNEYVSPYMPKHADTIVDLGANIGLASVFFLSQYPSASIFALEPSSDNFKMLVDNTKSFNGNIRCEMGAAWHSDGHVNLKSHDDVGADLGAWGLQIEKRYSDSNVVSAYNLNTLFNQAGFDTVDILKVDIEGSELELFSLGDLSWIKRVNFVCVETHDRFRDGTESAVRTTLLKEFNELPQSGENLLFVRK